MRDRRLYKVQSKYGSFFPAAHVYTQWWSVIATVKVSGRSKKKGTRFGFHSREVCAQRIAFMTSGSIFTTSRNVELDIGVQLSRRAGSQPFAFIENW